ncbi:MAG TPA: DUF4912 domain-containing protein [Bryobacteraceae bacterium]|nr:DUF4912 domain-containing protein [Bryobacteraceae bacterium]
MNAIRLAVRAFLRRARQVFRRVPPLALEEGDLPTLRGETMLALLAVGPHRLHLYWEAAQAGKAALRIYDVTGTPLDGPAAEHGYFEVEVDPSAGNWYVDVAEPAAAYCAELGFRGGDGEWVAAARSNQVTMPRGEPAEPDAAPAPAAPGPVQANETQFQVFPGSSAPPER